MKHLISKLSIAIAFICIVTQCYAQPDFSEDPYYFKKVTYELGGSLGVMNCLTDLGGNKTLMLVIQHLQVVYILVVLIKMQLPYVPKQLGA
jgi:hypothetical protein